MDFEQLVFSVFWSVIQTFVYQEGYLGRVDQCENMKERKYYVCVENIDDFILVVQGVFEGKLQKIIGKG